MGENQGPILERHYVEVCSGHVGFYHDPPESGAAIHRGDSLGRIVSLGLSIDIHASIDGVVEKVLGHGAPVEYSQPLITLRVEPPQFIPTPAHEAVEPNSNHYQFKAPIQGILYLCPGPDHPPFVEIGSEVDKKSVLCLLEVNKTYIDVTLTVTDDFPAERGRIARVCCNSEDHIAKGDVLFHIEPLQ